MAKKTNTLVLPKQMDLLVQAINCDNTDAAKLLVKRAMKSVYSNRSWQGSDFKEEDTEAVIALIRGINPKDTVESILAAQFVALHLQATSNVADENYNTMGYNLQMLRLSHQALNMLQQYRGKSQTINVNYNTLSHGDTTINSLFQAGVNVKNEE